MGLKNKDGVDLKDYWSDGVKTYLGMMFNGFPNAFTCYTPHGKQRPSRSYLPTHPLFEFILLLLC